MNIAVLTFSPDITEKPFNESLSSTLLCRDKFKLHTINAIIYMSDFILFKMNTAEDTLLGVLCINYESQDVWDIALICSVENKEGIGRQLLQTTIDLARQNNIRRVVGQGHLNGSQLLYKKFNFSEVNNRYELQLGGGKRIKKTKRFRKKKMLKRKTKRHK